MFKLRSRGPQLYISRKCPEFLIELFRLEVPEVGQGIIEILGASRDPGLELKLQLSQMIQSLMLLAHVLVCEDQEFNQFLTN